MMSYRDYYQGLYLKLVKQAEKAYTQKRYSMALMLIKASAWIQYVFSSIFHDKRVEDILKSISLTLDRTSISDGYKPKDDTFLIYDDFMLDNMGLSQQYIRALISTKCHVIYMTPQNIHRINSCDILNELKAASNVEIIQIKKTADYYSDSQAILDRIISLSPCKVFLHLQPHSVEIITAMYALPENLIKFQIDLTDHCYWLGAPCIDFDLVFRPYGAKMAKYFRNIPVEKIIYQPYYPIIKDYGDGTPLPEQLKGKIVVFAGSAYYKIESKDNRFQKFIIRVLDNNPNVVFIFAGLGNVKVWDLITKNKNYDGRFFLLGHRKDIANVISHSDICINTFPIGGGLVSQISAALSKPLLSLKDIDGVGDIDEIICQQDCVDILCEDEDELYSKVRKCIEDEAHRKDFGIKVKKCLIDENAFNKRLQQIIMHPENYIIRVNDDLPFIEKQKRHTRIMQDMNLLGLSVVKILGIRSSMQLCPRLLFDSFPLICHSFIIKLNKKYSV